MVRESNREPKPSSFIRILREGGKVTPILYESKHQKVVTRLYEILEEQGLVAYENGDYIRTAKAV